MLLFSKEVIKEQKRCNQTKKHNKITLFQAIVQEHSISTSIGNKE